ncbi:MAG: hypothetical protein JW839_14465, partial [Candidatus Lokiarchaeota archaeon]|nr:hypothetical protein [Candidatus Lokiarchaeota archaeon]
NQALATRKDDGTTRLVQVERVAYRDSVATPYVYVARPLGEGEVGTVELVPDEHEFAVFNIGEHYRLKMLGECTATSVTPAELKRLRVAVVDREGFECDVKYADLKNQVTREFLASLVGKDVFLDDKEAIDVSTCTGVQPGDTLLAYKLSIRHGSSSGSLERKVGDFRLARHRLFMAFHEDKKYAERYARFLEWCVASAPWLHLYLKKPVNNAFYCKVTAIEAGESFTILDRFGKTSTFPLKELEGLLLDHASVELKARDQESFLQKLAVAISTARHAIPWIPKW